MGIIDELKKLGVKEKVVSAVSQTPKENESLAGIVELNFKVKVVFTTHRIVSISKIPLVGANTEWRAGRIVLMGGNFQLLYQNLSGIRRAESQIRGSHAGHGALAGLIKKVGPTISRAVWPYEFQLLDLDSSIINKIYGVTSDQASLIASLSAKVGLRVIME